MLLEFRTRNYKSFTSELCFSMTPADKRTGKCCQSGLAREGIRNMRIKGEG